MLSARKGRKQNRSLLRQLDKIDDNFIKARDNQNTQHECIAVVTDRNAGLKKLSLPTFANGSQMVVQTFEGKKTDRSRQWVEND